jgi:hypothetical protein
MSMSKIILIRLTENPNTLTPMSFLRRSKVGPRVGLKEQKVKDLFHPLAGLQRKTCVRRSYYRSSILFSPTVYGGEQRCIRFEPLRQGKLRLDEILITDLFVYGTEPFEPTHDLSFGTRIQFSSPLTTLGRFLGTRLTIPAVSESRCLTF